jgi:transposase-like protein
MKGLIYLTEYLNKFNGISVAMDKLYNKNIQVDYRVSNWLEFYKIVLDIKERFL